MLTAMLPWCVQSDNPDPVTREGICDPRRQQMLREMHILDMPFELGQIPRGGT